MRAVDDLPDRLVQRGGIVDRRERGEAHCHPLGEDAVVRPRHEDAQERPTIPYRRERRENLLQDVPRGHQNSSASELITQSAPNSRCGQTGHPGHPLVLAEILGRLADEVDDALPAYASRISVVPSCERLSVAITKSTPAFR